MRGRIGFSLLFVGVKRVVGFPRLVQVASTHLAICITGPNAETPPASATMSGRPSVARIVDAVFPALFANPPVALGTKHALLPAVGRAETGHWFRSGVQEFVRAPFT